MIKNYQITDKELLGTNAFVRWGKTLIIFGLLFRNLLIKLILFLLSYIVLKDEKTLFFSSVGNYNFPIWRNEEDFQFKENPKYLAIYSAKKLKEYRTVFHVPNTKLFGKIRDLGIEPTRGLAAFWYMLRAKYLFVDNNNFFNPNASFLIGNFKIVQCWHGTPLKNMGEDKKYNLSWLEKVKKVERPKFDCALSSCLHSTTVYKKLFGNGSVDILELGYPRNDILFDRGFFGTEDVVKTLSLDKFSRTLLYAPTFRRLDKAVNPFDNSFLTKINEALKQNNYVLLVKQHPYAGSINFGEDYSNIADISAKTDDIQELFVNIDVLITDYSACIFDFSLTEKLQLLYPFDMEEYRKDRGDFYFDYCQENLPGLIISDKDGFIQKIEQLELLIEDKSTKDRIREFKNRFNTYTDGNSCERLFQYLKLGDM